MRDISLDPCNLCPRMCGARRLDGQRGICGANNDVRVARAALHFWEEPPISGERGSGTVFFSGCSLGCVYCQNREIAVREVGTVVDESKLAAICMNLEQQGALNVNFVTPTHHATSIVEAVSRARQLGLEVPIVWNTSGYERPEAIRMLRDTVDVYLTDFKYADPHVAQSYSHAADYPEVALAALDVMVETVGASSYDEVDGLPRMTKGVIVRHLILPAQLDNSKRVLELLFARYGNDIRYSIMNQYTPVMSGSPLAAFPELGQRVSDDDYERLLDFADDLGIEDYFWQDGPAAEESFIPAWDGTGTL